MGLNIKKQIRQTPQVGVTPYRQVHAHSTGNRNSTAQNEADFMSRKDLNGGFYTHVVGNGQIIQTAQTNRGAWDVGGGWNYETYAAVELIESHNSKEEFMRDYRLYVDLLRQLAKEAGLPTTLDTGDTGIISHNYATYNQPSNSSDHVDPYPYLAKWGITQAQFAKDLATGFSNTKKSAKPTAKVKVETVNYKDKAFAVRLYDVKSPDGISKVQFPIWTEKGGQDDLKWQDAVKQADGTWLFVDNAKNHKGELGKYNVHAYITTPDGVAHGVGATTTNLTPTVNGKLAIKDIDAEAGTFLAELSDVKSPVDVKAIKFPVWTEEKGQDDLKWYQANKNTDGSYSVVVPIKNHSNAFGVYNVHCYADVDGAVVGVAGTKATFEQAPKKDGQPTEIVVATKGDATVKTVVLSQEEFEKLQAPK